MRTRLSIITVTSAFFVPLILSLSLSGAIAQPQPESQSEQALAPITTTVEVEDRRIAPERQLDALEAYLNGINTLSGRFTQQGPDGAIAKGYINMERPGRVRFEYDGDSPVLIVSDGETLNLIDYEVGEITRWPVDDTPLALLLADRIELDDNIRVERFGREGQADLIAISADNPDNPSQGELTLIFIKNDENEGASQSTIGPYSLRAWQVVDAQGGLTTVSLASVALNLPLDPKLWRFEDPRGERMQRRSRR